MPQVIIESWERFRERFERDSTYSERFGRDLTYLERFHIQRDIWERFHFLREIWERFSIRRDRVKTIESGFVCDECECPASQCKVRKPR